MIIIKIMGGFASQVNKFMLGYSIAGFLKTELVLDISDYFDGYFRPYSLCYFKLPNCRLITYRDEIPSNAIYVRNSDVMEEMLAAKKDGVYYADREEDDYRTALDRYPGLEIHAGMDALKYMQFKHPPLFWNAFKKRMVMGRSVGIHIRRGDFVKLGWQDDTIFFKAAIAWFLEKDSDMHFYFFSNDIQWVMKQFGTGAQYHYVRSSDGNFGDVQELFCMASCTFRILSRFSGYGRLANILSAFWNREKGIQSGYAVMNACRVEESLEGQQNIEEPAERYSNEIRKHEIVKPEDGGILYLDDSLVKAYGRKYSAPVSGRRPEVGKASDAGPRRKEDSQLSLEEAAGWADEAGVDISGTNRNAAYMLTLKYEMYRDTENRAMQRECLESMEPSEQTKALWEEWYGVGPLGNKRFFLVTCEKRNRWKVRGMLRLALLLARCGAKVYYVPWADTEGSATLTDMDGKKLPFQAIGAGDISEIYNKYSGLEEENTIFIRDCIWKEDCGGRPGSDIYIRNMAEKKEKRAALRRLVSDQGPRGFLRSFIHRGVALELQKVKAPVCYSDAIKMPSEIQEACEKKYMELVEQIL